MWTSLFASTLSGHGLSFEPAYLNYAVCDLSISVHRQFLP